MEQPLTDKRNYGIDALRIVSMFMIVLLHTLGHGGILSSVNIFSGKYYAAWLIEIASYCAVNCYALISGYVGINSKYRYSKIVSLWVQIVFYTITITSCFAVFRPETINREDWIRAIFPITKSHYWYLTAYFALFIFMPLLNAAVKNLSKRELSRFLTAVIAMFSTIPNILQADPYKLSFGYSTLWLCILYVLGGFIKRYDVFSSIGKIKALLIYALCILITWGSKIVISKITLNVYGEIRYDNTLVQYNSPTIIFASIILLIFFSKLEFRLTAIKKLISLLAAASLGVYIIHENFLIRTRYIFGYSKSFADGSTIVMAIKVIVAAAAIYLGCSVIETVRIQLFKVLRINKIIGRIDKRGL